MQKRILSMILSLSIVASLFAGLSFSVSATFTLYDKSNYTIKKGNYGEQKDEIPPAQSLLKGIAPLSVQMFNTIEGDAPFTSDEPVDYTPYIHGWTQYITAPDRSDGGPGGAGRIIGSEHSAYEKLMFVETEYNEDGSFKTWKATDDETKQWLQINYALDGAAIIDKIVLGQFAFNAWNMSHYKLILSDTEAGLSNLDAAKAVIDVDSSLLASNWKFDFTKKELSAKYIGVRIIGAYSSRGNHTETTLNQTQIRLNYLGVVGAYVDSVDEVNVTATTSLGKNDLISKEIKYGNEDKNGNYAIGTATLTAEATYSETSCRYDFEGWYKDGVLVSEDTEYVYDLANGSANFVAKYSDGELILYDKSNYTITKGNYSEQKDEIPPAQSLLKGIAPLSVQMFNTIEGDAPFTSDEPVDYTPYIHEWTQYITAPDRNDGGPGGAGRIIGPEHSKYEKLMFVETEYNEDGSFKTWKATDDETKQWLQLNYALEDVATIDKIVLGQFQFNAWNMSHYKLILSDTEEGLTNLGAANAVIDVDSSLLAGNWKLDFTKKAITAKYIGVRIIAAYNSTRGNHTETTLNQTQIRLNYLGVVGSYVEPVKEVRTVTATTEDKALKGLVSASDVAYGNPDKNGAYASAEVTVKAEATYTDGTYDYTFAGWFLNEEPYTEDAEFVYDATKDDANFVAKYEKQVKIIYHTVTVKYAGNLVADYQVADGEGFDLEVARQAVNQKYPATAKDGIVVQFVNGDKVSKINADLELGGYLQYRVRFLAEDGETVIYEQTIGGSAVPTPPKAPAVEGYTFIGWDKEVQAEAAPRDYVAKYEINEYTVTFKAEGAEDIVKTVKHGETLTDIPTVPEKEGYAGAWEGVELWIENVTADMVVNAVYTIKTYTVTFKVEGAEDIVKTVNYGDTLTDIPAVPEKEGYIGVWESEDLSNIKENKIVDAVYEIKTFTVTFKAEGEVLKTETVDWNEAATAPTAPAKYGYTFKEWDKEFANVVADIEVNAVYDFTGIIVKFESITGKLLGEVIVEHGDVPNYDEVKAINAKVEAVYGYTVKLDGENVVWDQDVYGTAIVDGITVRPEYEAIEDLNTNVKVYDVNGAVLVDRDARYDSAITLASKQGATYWADKEGKVLLAAASGTLYACGGAMEIYAKTGEFEVADVAIVGKIHDEKGFSVFAHVNVEGATKYGIIFASSTYYNEVNANFEITDVTPNRVMNVEVETANVEGKVDFMTTLNYAAGKNPTRYARAYVVVGDQYIYSDVIRNK